MITLGDKGSFKIVAPGMILAAASHTLDIYQKQRSVCLTVIGLVVFL